MIQVKEKAKYPEQSWVKNAPRVSGGFHLDGYKDGLLWVT